MHDILSTMARAAASWKDVDQQLGRRLEDWLLTDSGLTMAATDSSLEKKTRSISVEFAPISPVPIRSA
ncbi:hypothetical protein [Embleya sp. NPDC059237]|uniref:hypothetical protein n=1 Tax=Embleya sp. NPDC059237 TaxID=3346784 RepID=UPI003674486C